MERGVGWRVGGLGDSAGVGVNVGGAGIVRDGDGFGKGVEEIVGVGRGRVGKAVVVLFGVGGNVGGTVQLINPTKTRITYIRFMYAL